MMTALSAFFVRHRRRFASVMLAGGVLLGLRDLAPRFPRETDVEFRLGPDHAEITELRVAYRRAGDEVAGASFSFPDGAPRSVRHRVKLPSGAFQVWSELRTRGGHSTLLRQTLRTPVSGVVRLDLSDESGAAGTRE